MPWYEVNVSWLVILFCIRGAVGVYFSQSEYIFLLSDPSDVVGRVIALSNNTHLEICGPKFFNYSLNQRNGDASSLFSINETGFISYSGGNDVSGYKYDLTVNVICRKGQHIEVASVFTTVLYKKDACHVSDGVLKYNSDIAQLDQLADGLCFQKKELEFAVEENNDLVPIGFLGGCPFVNISSFALRIYSEYNATIFDVIDETSEIVIKRQLDRESGSDLITSNVVCTVWFPDINITLHRTAHLSVHIGDANDNPIRFRVDERVRLAENHLITKATDQVLSLVAFDEDDTPNIRYKFEILKNPHGACSQIHTLTCHVVPTNRSNLPYSHVICLLRTNVTKPPLGSDMEYKCTIALTDEGATRSKANNGNKLSVIEVQIPPDKEPTVVHVPQITRRADILSSAALYSTIYDASLDVKGNDTLYAIQKDLTRAFRITVESGIVYIDNLEYFRRMGTHGNLTIKTFNPRQKIILNINVIQYPWKHGRQRICNETCSRYNTKEACQSSCGLGAKFGNCRWRRGDAKSMSRNFSTCVPQLSTCLDGKCDELESKHPLLCPQDCTRVIKGEGQYHENGKGIARGTSPCWCDYNGECSCLRDHAHKINGIQKFRQTFNQSMLQTMSSSYSLNAEEHENNASEKQNIVPKFHPKAGAQTSETTICDWDCRTTIAATAGCVGAMLCIIVLTWRLRKFRCRSRHAIKHVSSTGSISAVPSDYMDDRDYRTSHSSPQWSPKRTIDFSQVYTIDDNKWEVPREKLILDKTLGEGEFGRVVKAVAYNLDGKDGYKEVAVKMLKNCASSSELQDLLSEYNLLQDVNHPNVIRLLGACTKDGPFYVIVEYCEHGSLLHYLRRSRLEENGYVNHRYRRYFRRKSGDQEGGEMEILNIRDLLSFAWQIAKGMRYLSEIKLVHRDLAARNVLVGTGKVLKISDFGLTRDVYEADTYLKRSKGRIPVKWLAPESLYAQIYTTQSDVWSFGIVLWEIVTLGAPPYPGIPPERLYNLLIAGYRMDRPEGCSDELYAVMQKCWKTDPAERPNFANLADIFDKMLQQRTEYLELTGGFEDSNSELFERQNNENTTLSSNVEEEIQYGSINTNSNPYLTPATSNIRNDILIDKTERAKLATGRNKNATQGNTDNGIDSENVALLLDSRSAVYSNSSESDEELTVRQAGILQTIA